MPALKALGGRGESGRNPRVRPVPEPEMSRKAVDTTGEVLRGGCVAEGDGGAATVSVGVEAGLLTFLTEVVAEVDGGAAMVLSKGDEAVLLAVLAAEGYGKTCHERLAGGQEAKNREGDTWGRR